MKQIALLKQEPKSYGGELLKTRKGRSTPRPLDTKNTMHLVLRSTKARGAWSFTQPRHAASIRGITQKFARRYGVRILNAANVGNHLHFHIKLSNRFTYRPFIRAVTGAIAMAVTGANRWKKNAAKASGGSTARKGFWDYRPFTRVVLGGWSAVLRMQDYLRINTLEGFGVDRLNARLIIARERDRLRV